MWPEWPLDGGLPRAVRSVDKGDPGRPRRSTKTDNFSCGREGKLGTAGSGGQESAVCYQSRLTASAVRVNFGSLEVWALLDSGADFSMVRDGLQQKLKTELGCEATAPLRSAKGAGGNPLVIVEVLREVHMSIRGEPFVCPRLAVVTGLLYDVILGRDFCCRYRTIIDDEQGMLRVKGLTIPLPTYPEIRAPRGRVILEENVVIPGRSVSMVSAVSGTFTSWVGCEIHRCTNERHGRTEPHGWPRRHHDPSGGSHACQRR